MFFLFNVTATTEIYTDYNTLALHDALPIFGDRGRPDEGDGRDAGMLQDRVHRLLVTVHDVEHTVRQAGLLEGLRHPDRRRRVLLARLQHDGVADRKSTRLNSSH